MIIDQNSEDFEDFEDNRNEDAQNIDISALRTSTTANSPRKRLLLKIQEKISNVENLFNEKFDHFDTVAVYFN